MVIGNGLIAKAFSDFSQSSEFLFFCSGVSNSLCNEPGEFQRERKLLESAIERNSDKSLIYFSTCSIEDPSLQDSPYVNHKKAIENIIRESGTSHYIFRLSNVVGSTPNGNTILNFLFNAINEGRDFNLWMNSNRNLIDVDHIVSIVKSLVNRDEFMNCTTNIANKYSYDVIDIVSEIEVFLNKTAKYNLVNKGARFSISIAAIESIITQLAIDFDHSYVRRLLEKYYKR